MCTIVRLMPSSLRDRPSTQRGEWGPMDPSYRVRQRALVRRVDALWERGVLTGPMIEQARAADHVLAIDFEDERFVIKVCPRETVARDVPPDCRDEALLALTRGQPEIKMGETVAAWFIAAEWVGEQLVVEVHGRVRAWRDAYGSA